MLIPYYAPHSGYPEEEIDKTTQELSEFLSKIPIKNTTIIVGADINASNGTRSTDEPQGREEDEEFEFQRDTIPELLRPHGNPHGNINGERILNLMREHDLGAASTVFESNKKHNTWRNPQNKRPHQINHFLIPKSQLCHTIDLKRKLDSIDSDHAALCIEFRLLNEALLSRKTENNKEAHQKKSITSSSEIAREVNFREKFQNFF